MVKSRFTPRRRNPFCAIADRAGALLGIGDTGVRIWEIAKWPVIGLLVAWVLVRYKFPGKQLFDALVDLPFALPTAVAGIALTALYAPMRREGAAAHVLSLTATGPDADRTWVVHLDGVRVITTPARSVACGVAGRMLLTSQKTTSASAIARSWACTVIRRRSTTCPRNSTWTGRFARIRASYSMGVADTASLGPAALTFFTFIPCLGGTRRG